MSFIRKRSQDGGKIDVSPMLLYRHIYLHP